MANKIAKKFPAETGGVYIIDSELKRVKALKWLPVQDVWGIGNSHSKRLKSSGVNTAYDFTQLEEPWVKKAMGVVGCRLWHELKGYSCLEMGEVKAKKNISTTRSFEGTHADFDYLRERVVTFTVTCAEKLRNQGSLCNTIMVFVHTNGFREDQPQYSRNIVMPLPFPTNSSPELSRFAVEALKKIFKEGYEYKKAGVILMDFSPAGQPQLGLFENSDSRFPRLMKTMDAINRSIGAGAIKLAAQDLKRTWKMRQTMLSKKYTTRIEDIIEAKA